MMKLYLPGESQKIPRTISMTDFLRVGNIVWIFRGLNNNIKFGIHSLHSNWRLEMNMDNYFLMVGWYL